MKDWQTFLWLALPVGLGIGTSWIPWGDPAGFHGTGTPFPRVIWDQGRDYVSPLAPFFNVVLFLILAGIVYGLIRLIRRIVGKGRSSSAALKASPPDAGP